MSSCLLRQFACVSSAVVEIAVVTVASSCDGDSAVALPLNVTHVRAESSGACRLVAVMIKDILLQRSDEGSQDAACRRRTDAARAFLLPVARTSMEICESSSRYHSRGRLLIWSRRISEDWSSQV